MREWPTVPLSDLLSLRTPDTEVNTSEEYHFAGVYCFGRGVFVGQKKLGIAFAYRRLTQLRGGNFVYPKLMAWEGALGVVPPKCDGLYVSPEFPVFEVNVQHVLPQYLDYYFRRPSIWPELSGGSTGTNVRRRRLHPTDFLRYRLPLPPLREQHRIVERITALVDRIEEGKRLRDEADTKLDALREACVGDLLVEASHHPTVELKGVCSKIGSGSTPSGGKAAYPASGIPLIRSMNVRMRSFQWDEIAYISPETHNQMAGTKVRPQDVLLNITGASIGRVACAPTDVIEANVNQHVAILRPNSELLPRYLMYWLSQPTVQRLIASEQKGATRQGFTKKQIEELELPLPPLATQERLLASLDACQDRFAEAHRAAHSSRLHLQAIIPAILDQAFCGEL